MVTSRVARAGAVLVLALVALGVTVPASVQAPQRRAPSGAGRTPTLVASPLGTEVAVVATRLEEIGGRLAPARTTKGRSPVPLVALLAAAWAASAFWRRHAAPRALRLVVTPPLAGAGVRAPPLG